MSVAAASTKPPQRISIIAVQSGSPVILGLGQHRNEKNAEEEPTHKMQSEYRVHYSLQTWINRMWGHVRPEGETIYLMLYAVRSWECGS